MASGTTHAVAGALAGVTAMLLNKGENIREQDTLIAAGLGTFFGKLPDLLEPSLKNPSHRQFYHSIVMLAAVGYSAKRTYEWQPKDEFEALIRSILLCAGAGYLSHLLLDSLTSKSLPIVGKI